MEDPLEGGGCYTHATKRNRLMPDLARLHDDLLSTVRSVKRTLAV